MKLKTIVLCFLLFPIFLQAQHYLNRTEAQVTEAAINSGGKKLDKTTKDNFLLIKWENPKIRTAIYVFFENGYSIKTINVPYDKECLSQWITVLNNTYTKKENNQWKAYTVDGEISITLTDQDYGGCGYSIIYEVAKINGD